MIKRNARNIDKIVKIVNYQKDWDGRLGKVVGFRGDLDKGDPFATVFVYDLGSVVPIPGSKLEVIGGPGTLSEVVRSKMKGTAKAYQKWLRAQSGKTLADIDWSTEPKIEDDLRQLIALAKKKIS